MSKIISIATALPQYKYAQKELFQFADVVHCQNEIETRKLRFLYNHSGIDTRYSVLPDFLQDKSERTFFGKEETLEPMPGIERRMEYYQQSAVDLSVEAITKCIKDKISPQEITHLITVSCTGMSAPGLDLQIMELMKLPPEIQRTSVNFMGCYAAIHGLKMADAFCKADANAKVVVVCTELCTLHFQKENTIDNLTASLLFADGSAAVLMQNESAEKGIILDSFFSKVALKGKNEMAWAISSKGFLMTLSGYVPDLLKEDFEELVHAALKKNELSKEAITHWCIHPGGKKILEVIAQCMQLPADALNDSYDVLRDYGNMSSATILFVLDKIFEELKAEPKEAKIFGAAFGPGLTMETFTASYG